MKQGDKALYHDRGRLQAVQVMLCARLPSLLEALTVKLSRQGKKWAGACPVHGGDNPGALNFYPEGHTQPGYWRCNTHNCHKFFHETALGFVRGVLSHQKLGWTFQRDRAKTDAQKKFGFYDAIDWACDFLDQPLADIKVDTEELERLRFVHQVATLTKKPKTAGQGMSREQVRRRLKIPADYFVQRGWSRGVLDRYDVGLCDDPTRKFYERVVVPIYADDYKDVAGFTARSVHPECDICRLWHAPGLPCPTTGEQVKAACKWRHSDGFDRESHLYNWWFAHKEIERTAVVCLCEGPGDVWRLEEAGVHCGVAMFGNRIGDGQQVRLEMSGAMTVISLLNNDQAGRDGNDELRDRLSRCYRLVFPQFEKNDLGDMTAAEVAGLVRPLVEKHTRRF